jgi:hypothetical protein
MPGHGVSRYEATTLWSCVCGLEAPGWRSPWPRMPRRACTRRAGRLAPALWRRGSPAAANLNPLPAVLLPARLRRRGVGAALRGRGVVGAARVVRARARAGGDAGGGGRRRRAAGLQLLSDQFLLSCHVPRRLPVRYTQGNSFPKREKAKNAKKWESKRSASRKKRFHGEDAGEGGKAARETGGGGGRRGTPRRRITGALATKRPMPAEVPDGEVFNTSSMQGAPVQSSRRRIRPGSRTGSAEVGPALAGAGTIP